MVHVPVLLEEALTLLAVASGGLYVDGTLGLGGHTQEMLRRSAPDGRVLAIDRDEDALGLCRERLGSVAGRLRLEHANYRDIPALLGDERASGILLDLGVSSLQLDSPERGFSFQKDGPLDMRMDQTQPGTAADVVNSLDEGELADVFYQYGEERKSRRVARAIAETRRRAPIRTTSELAAIVRRAVGRSRPGFDPATRVFQALRIFVNGELEGLGESLVSIAGCLRPGGRLAVIAFHSLEDRIVKQTFRSLAADGFLLLTKKPLVPSAAETGRNPRARSAKLRGLVRVAA